MGNSFGNKFDLCGTMLYNRGRVVKVSEVNGKISEPLMSHITNVTYNQEGVVNERN